MTMCFMELTNKINHIQYIDVVPQKIGKSIQYGILVPEKGQYYDPK